MSYLRVNAAATGTVGKYSQDKWENGLINFGQGALHLHFHKTENHAACFVEKMVISVSYCKLLNTLYLRITLRQ